MLHHLSHTPPPRKIVFISVAECCGIPLKFAHHGMTLSTHFIDENKQAVRVQKERTTALPGSRRLYTPFGIIEQFCPLGQGPDKRSSIQRRAGGGLTRNVAMAAPVRKPASTSDQWLRYSATRTTPTRKAGHSRARQREGFTRREPFTRNTRVTYICGTQTDQRMNPRFSGQSNGGLREWPGASVGAVEM